MRPTQQNLTLNRESASLRMHTTGKESESEWDDYKCDPIKAVFFFFLKEQGKGAASCVVIVVQRQLYWREESETKTTREGRTQVAENVFYIRLCGARARESESEQCKRR